MMNLIKIISMLTCVRAYVSVCICERVLCLQHSTSLCFLTHGANSPAHRCDKYPDMPPYCVLVQDPNDQCCQTPLCTPPVTQTPPEQVTQSPNPGVTVVPPFGQSTVTPAPGQPNTPVPGQPSTVAPPYNPYTTVQPRRECPVCFRWGGCGCSCLFNA